MKQSDKGDEIIKLGISAASKRNTVSEHFDHPDTGESRKMVRLLCSPSSLFDMLTFCLTSSAFPFYLASL